MIHRVELIMSRLPLVVMTIAMTAVGAARAQDYPTQAVNIVLGYGAGGGADVAARLFADKVGTLSKQTFVVLNKPGANGNIAANEVVRAKPDGHTLLWSPSSAYASNHLMYKATPYDPTRDLTLASTFNQYGFVLLVSKDNPANSVAELTAQLQKKGGGMYGSSATSLMASAELYKLAAGLKSQQVNYKTTPDAVRDLAGNQVDFVFADAAFAIAQVQAGRVKALAVTLQKRMTSAPEIPTMEEAGLKGYELNGWMGLAAPKATPSAIVLKLNKWAEQIISMPDVRKYILESGSEPYYLPLDQIGPYQAAQIEKWKKIIADSGIKVE